LCIYDCLHKDREEFIMIIYALILISFLALDLTILLVRIERARRFQMNAGLVLVTSFFAYTVPLPFSRLLLGTESSGSDVESGYMICSLLAALGLTIGLLMCPQSPSVAENAQAFSRAQSLRSRWQIGRGLMVVTVALTLGTTCFYILYHAGFSLERMAGAYLVGIDSDDSVTVVDTLIIPFAIAAALHFMHAARTGAVKGTSVVFMKALCFVLFAMFLSQGHRNLMLYLALSILALRTYGRPIRLGSYAIAVIVSVVGLYAIGIVRNWGWVQIDQVAIDKNAFDPLRGELGTTFSVYEKLQEGRGDDSLLMGRTYTLDTVLNLVPQQVWSSRPPSPAIQFSRNYFGTDDLPSGLGYSPVIEAIINFSTYGIVFVFAITTVLFIRLDGWLRRKSRVGVLTSCLLLPTIVNWNRIDFATCLKILLIYAAFFWGLDKLFYSPDEAVAPAQPVTRLPLRYAERRS
jgi:hypothetical protein